MKSIVTGGAGFIGSNLVDRLVQLGHKVIVLDNFSTGKKSNLHHHNKKNVKIIRIDIKKKAKLNKYFKGVNYVFHLAGLASLVESLKYPNKYFETNVLGTLNIIDAAKKAKIKKFVYAASASCYGIPKKFPTGENAIINTMHPYATTKWQAEVLIMQLAKLYKFPAISLRLFNAYGPRQSLTGAYKSVFGIFLSQKKAKKPLTIVGDGNQTRDFIHVTDLVNVLVKAALSKKIGDIYNVGSGKETKVNTLAKLIGGKKIYISKRSSETNRSLADIKKIKRDLSWKPLISIRDGVKVMLKDIEDCKVA